MDRREEALRLLRILLKLEGGKNKQLLIAFDLDYTLWPANCFEDTFPPYSAVDSAADHATVTFDQGKRKLSMYPEAIEIIQWCLSNNVIMTVCSLSPKNSSAKAILEAMKLWNFFKHPQIFRDKNNKKEHMKILKDSVKCNYADVIFFDDVKENIKECRKLGVTSILVDRQKGLCWSVFLNGLKSHDSQKKSSASLFNWLMPKPSILEETVHNDVGAGDVGVSEIDSKLVVDKRVLQSEVKACKPTLQVSQRVTMPRSELKFTSSVTSSVTSSILSCPACTFDNPSSNTRCEMCGTTLSQPNGTSENKLASDQCGKGEFGENGCREVSSGGKRKHFDDERPEI